MKNNSWKNNNLLRESRENRIKAQELMERVEYEHGNYSYKSGFPEIYEGEPWPIIADGILLKEAAENDGPWYVSDDLDDNDYYIIEEDGTTYRARSIDDIELYLDGRKELLDTVNEDMIWC